MAAFLFVFGPMAATAPWRQFTADDYWFVGHGQIRPDPSSCTVLQSFCGDWLTGARGTGGWLRPIPRVFFLIDDLLWGINSPWGYYLTNFLLHGLCAAMVAGLAIWCLGARSRWAALAAGLFFGWYPYAGGAVSWVASRTDVLAVFFLLAALGSALWLRHWAVSLSLTALCTVLSCLSKESGFFLPLWMGASVLVSAKRIGWRRGGLALATCVTAAAATFLWRIHCLGSVGGYVEQFRDKSIGELLRWGLEFATGSCLFGPGMLGGLLVACGIVVAFSHRRPGQLSIERSFVPLVALVFIMAAAVPVVGLPLPTVENARYFYMAGIGWALLGGWVVAGVEQHSPRRAALITGIATAALVAAWLQIDGPWRRAGLVTNSLVSQMIEPTLSAGDRPVVSAYRDMDGAGYEARNLHARDGGKVLPWDQAPWAIWRRTLGKGSSTWGFQPALPEPESARLLLIGRLDEDKVEVFDLERLLHESVDPVEGDLVVRIPPSNQEEDLQYAILRLDVAKASPPWLPRVRRPDGTIVETKTVAGESPSSHILNLGMVAADNGEWRIDAAEGTQLSRILLTVYTMTPVTPGSVE